MSKSKLVSENEVEASIAKFLSGLGWRRTRNNVGRFRTENGARVTVGVIGFPDWTYRRALLRGVCEILHVETKSSTGKASAVQLEVIAALNHIGEPAVLANSLDSFKDWYHDQGFTTDWRRRAVNPQLTKPVVDAAEFRVAV
jgi:hypothetical protein